MTTTLESPAATPLPSLATPKVQFFLTPTLKKNLIAFLLRGSRRANPHLHVSRDATHSRFTLLTGEDCINVTFSIPHAVTAEPATVQAERHRIYTGSFLLHSTQAFLSLIRNAEPQCVITLGLSLAGGRAYFAFRIHSQDNRIALDLADKTRDRARYEPLIPTPEVLRQNTYHFSASWIKPVLQRALEFASTDETRYVLNGIYMDFDEAKPDQVTLVATNGRILIRNHFAVHPSSLPTRPLHSHVQPSSLLVHTLSLLGSCASSSLHIGLLIPSQPSVLHHLVLSDGSTVSLSHPIGVSSPYPNYRAVIPAFKEASWRTLHLADPAEAGKICADITRGCESSTVRLRIDGSHAHLAAGGSAQFLIATVGGGGGAKAIDPMEPIVSAYDSTLLIPIVKHSTKLHWEDPETPLIGTAPGLTFVIMPLRGTK